MAGSLQAWGPGFYWDSGKDFASKTKLKKMNGFVKDLLRKSKTWEYLNDVFPNKKKKELKEDFINILNEALNVNVELINLEKDMRVPMEFCSKCGMKKHPIYGAHCHSPTCPHEID